MQVNSTNIGSFPLAAAHTTPQSQPAGPTGGGKAYDDLMKQRRDIGQQGADLQVQVLQHPERTDLKQQLADTKQKIGDLDSQLMPLMQQRLLANRE